MPRHARGAGAPFYCGYTLEEVAQAAQAAPGPNSAQLMIQLYPARLAGDESNGFDGMACAVTELQTV